uniref:Uncharacterized protein n=1 Tax=Parascaris equorum TaxID=6256 RepID=A0A914S1M0_PAREQ
MRSRHKRAAATLSKLANSDRRHQTVRSGGGCRSRR